jgi:Leucine-rich repeat (LRR) protein
MSRYLITVVVFLAATTAYADPPTADQIQAWIRDLDSSKYRVRDRAARQLRDAGADAAAPLAKAARNGSAESSDRALRLLGDMIEGNDTRVEIAARRQLRRLADGESAVAGDARFLLNRQRHRLFAQLVFARVSFQEEDGKITTMDLDRVFDLDAVLPLLKYFPEIEDLSISNKRFGDAGAIYLADLPNLQRLNLFQSDIGDDGLKHLTGLKNLRQLPMGATRVTDAGLKTVAVLTQLEYVGVRGNNITDAGLLHLKGLTSLTGLNLAETNVTDNGLSQLAPLVTLRDLYLNSTAITNDGLDHIKNFKDLQSVYLSKTYTTEAARSRLKEALPNLTIYDDSNR